MNNFNIKSLMLGIGIGMIITAVISIIYLHGVNPATAMNEQEIKNLARQYGMVDNKEISSNIPDYRDSTKENTRQSSQSQQTTQPPQSTQGQQPVQTQQPPPPGEFVLEVKIGDTSEIVGEKLAAAGFVADKATFVKEMISSGKVSELQVGTFKLTQGMELNKLITLITTPYW